MAILKMEDLNRRMTEVVSQYMSQGLILNCTAMSGSQGELGKVALANDTHVYIIYLHNDCVGESFVDRKDVVKLTVELHVRDDRNTYWLGKGTVVYEDTFYQVTNRYHEVYTDSETDCREMNRKHYSRYDHVTNWRTSKYNPETIINIIKSRTGRKRVFTENIVSVERRIDSNVWRICYVFSGRQDVITVQNV